MSFKKLQIAVLNCTCVILKKKGAGRHLKKPLIFYWHGKNFSKLNSCNCVILFWIKFGSS